MHRPRNPQWQVPALGVAALLFASFAPEPDIPAPPASFDPARAGAAVCGSRTTDAALLPAADADDSIPLFPDLTVSAFALGSSDPQARRYFSQGLMLSYGFNHAGAVRSFREAQRRDPQCALCWWGEALALGPNINAPMDDRDHAAALEALDRAMVLRAQASPHARALIEAMAQRYVRDAGTDRAALDAAYADAMLAVAQRFPDDDDIAVLAAEAAMDTTPWNYWEADGRTPIGRIGDAVRLVDAVLRRNPDHVQAAHLQIHLLEASDPARAEAAADRLAAASVPSAGHLLHMPAHIYARRGRHAEAMRVNVAAARADEAYIRSAGDRGLLAYGYYPHNIHFILMSAQMAGDMTTAIREAQRLRAVLDPETSARIGWIQAIDAAPYLAMAQFAAPATILALPPPDPRLPYAAGMRHYARAVAYAQLRDPRGFDGELAAIAALRAADVFADMIAQGVPASDLLVLAEAVARGRMAMAHGRHGEAARHYRRAIVIENGLPYMEPPYWYYPVQVSLGAALFLDGRHAEASAAFRAALAQTPHNGWALYGLAQSEVAQGRKQEAAAARQALDKAWLGDPGWLRMDRL